MYENRPVFQRTKHFLLISCSRIDLPIAPKKFGYADSLLAWPQPE